MSTSKRAKASSSPDQTALDQETSTGIHTDEIQVLCTADNTTITLPFAMAKMSNVLASCIEDVDNAGSAPFPITHVTGNTLMVCKAYLGIDDACAASDYLSSFGSSQEKLKKTFCCLRKLLRTSTLSRCSTYAASKLQRSPSRQLIGTPHQTQCAVSLLAF